MDLVNKQVTHKVFGKGNVIKHSGSYIKIDFPSGNKKFVFPDAFGTYLTLTDQRMAKLVGEMAQEAKKEKQERELKRKKLRALKKERRQDRIKEKWLARKQKRQRRLRVHPSSQSVFWCELQELDDVFEDWQVFTGLIKSGQDKGKPRRLARVYPNSAALLTVRGSDMKEKERRILGMFMVDEAFNGRQCTDGYIPAHVEYRLRLSKEESEKMLFWNYYVNEKHPQRMVWNTGRHRYFENIWMAQILKDVVALKKEGSPERTEAERFFKYFCEKNRIEEDQLPKPNGALMRS